MSRGEGGGPAFPLVEVGPHCNEGMSLRDWFAGQALNGLAARGGGFTQEERATEAYQFADAMLAVRKGNQS